MLLDSLSRQLMAASREKDCYLEFLSKASSSIVDEADEARLKSEIEMVGGGLRLPASRWTF